MSDFLTYDDYQLNASLAPVEFTGYSWPEAECGQECLAIVGCHAINFDFDTNLCTGFGEPPKSLGSDAFNIVLGTVFKMRMCL